jgi:cysteinyl-tRNA synthetase
MLQIYNSLSRSKQVFTPLQPGQVRMYVCGMTVYDLCHVGHARVLVVFDVVARYLRHLGYDVTYVRNITDIDDKIIQRANDNGETISELTERFITEMHRDAKALGVMPPDIEPRATGSMTEIIAMIRTLIDNDHAYTAANGDVYYDVSGFATYGQLSGKRLEDLRAGERVAVDEGKDDPLDFVLWKSAKPGEPSWASPWGEGRPGWHIECSAMATHCLGNSFDLHGGGMDLMFPHHENEIAQSEAATGQTFVTTWMHNGFVNIDNEKMSKSLGNFFTVRDVLEKYDAEYVRFFILTSHYRSPLNYSDKSLDNAKGALGKLYNSLRGLDNVKAYIEDSEYTARFLDAMNDDFNTPNALAELQGLAREINRLRLAKEDNNARSKAGLLVGLGGILGMLQSDPEDFFKRTATVVKVDYVGSKFDIPQPQVHTYENAKIDGLIDQRDAARRKKDWAEADRIRDELDAQGVVLEDVAGKTIWRRK